ncbi:MAG: glycosyltransferase family 4 protein [Candidatus Nezhaarchaeota archaeon]|nr:glycosyltransferase family 4 protein [Candidatus Nezhaarchaeota archaeon]MCX8142167.1 glycosyltransferase family 4 protein [Candidatus Nezhaarchaeota archaeon]MDW8050050.1 glycosyltransferase family 4 protein [Nitrososphaerota archaeon]
MKMRVLMLSWEYPPRIIGGLARHVYWISRALAQHDVDVTVVTLDYPEVPAIEHEKNLKVIRVMSYGFHSSDFPSWVHQFNLNMVEAALEEGGDFSIIHAHDWLTATAGIALKHILRRPLISTMHSTEYGRRGGLIRDVLQRHIHDMEWWLTYESWKVIVCSNYMKSELRRSLSVPDDKVVVIPNGVNPISIPTFTNLHEFRRKYAEDWEKIVLFVGRIVYEKGPHTLIDATLQLLSRRQDLKVVIVGEGPMRKELMNKVDRSGFKHKFYFTGFIEDIELTRLYMVSDVAVFPSLYEPFGIVALEAMSAGKPLIVSDVGGLSEIVVDGFNGLKVPVGDVNALSSALEYLIGNPDIAKRMGENGARRAREVYSWDVIGEKTLEVYHKVLQEYLNSPWKPKKCLTR